MSRCFPFPPPGYVVNGIRDEAMIDSIKGAEEKCKKEHRKERKRDKKEKKDKKRKEREGGSEKHSHKRRRKEEEVAKEKVDLFRKEAENINCLEKSSLTVERELLQSTSQNSCDSTLNSNEKEKKQQQPLNGRHSSNNERTLNSNELPKEKEKQLPLDGRHNNNNNDSESIIRIRLPIRRPKDPETMITNKDQPCPSRDLKLDSVAREQPQHPCSTSAAPVHASKPREEKRKEHTSTRKHKEKHREKKLPSTTQETYQPSRLCRLCPPSMAEQFLNVVENWVPSRVELSSSEEDECWWLVKKPSNYKTDTERCKQLLGRNNETKEVIRSSIAWPRARLLPEADVYALPYTVPF